MQSIEKVIKIGKMGKVERERKVENYRFTKDGGREKRYNGGVSLLSRRLQ